MCILFIAVQQHPNFPLIVAANRDEFHARNTLPSQFWPEHSHVLAGKDMQAGGSWMGVSKHGRLAALTNIRAPGKERSDAVSRGELVMDFLTQDFTGDAYLHRLSKTAQQYNGYNLLFGSLDNLQVYNNFEDSVYSLSKGVYGLSNANLNSPWPKLDLGRSELAKYCQQPGELNIEHLFDLLGNSTKADDEVLPQTGVPIEWERKLSSIFIESPDYGTRSSTVLLLDSYKQVFWQERSFNPRAELIDQQTYLFKLQDMSEK
ncbi:NRDE family protein [Glaciecola siphonariae]|uniref:NRDE family protein n=1 Tax=Glaciecola siphonariae TaxID=521012 RepID=A0ABV9LSX3_9ALTE